MRLTTYSSDVPLEKLYPTEDFLENDKLALVFMKMIEENYDVPIIVVEREDDYYVLDGHHRAYISSKIQRKNIRSLVMRFPRGTSYRDVPKSSLEDMNIREVALLSNVILIAWARILKILKQYEAFYHMHFYMRREKILLKDLSPTEPELLKTQIQAISKLRPDSLRKTRRQILRARRSRQMLESKTTRPQIDRSDPTFSTNTGVLWNS